MSIAVAVLALAAAFLVGSVIVDGVPQGVALLAAICFFPAVLLNVPLGVALWFPLVFTAALPGVHLAERAASALVAVAWVATLMASRRSDPPLFQQQRALAVAFVAFCIWLALSASWAEDLGLVREDLWRWYPNLLMFVIVATTITRPRHVWLVAGSFVVGAVVSVALGLYDNSITNSASHLERATSRAARLHGAEGDPNSLAAGLVSAMFIAAGLALVTRRTWLRLGLASTIALLAVGLAETESRGGVLAAAAAIAAAFVFFSGRRRQLLLLVVVIIATGGIQFAASETAYQRFTAANREEGSGRTELWRVAWSMASDRPLLGVGLNNFVVESPRYAREVGSLEYVELIAASQPKVAHNAFLQVLTETGIVGLTLFLVVIVLCMRAQWLAALRFAVFDRPDLAIMSRAVLVATIGLLTAAYFLSIADDMRLWLLLALGPALLRMATGAEVALRSQQLTGHRVPVV